MEKLTRLRVLRVMSYDLLHFLIKEKLLHDFLTECITQEYSTILLQRIKFAEAKKQKLINVFPKSEFSTYFAFIDSITLTENCWWRYDFRFKEYMKKRYE